MYYRQSQVAVGSRSRRTRRFLAAAVTAALSLSSAACGGSESDPDAAPATRNSSVPQASDTESNNTSMADDMSEMEITDDADDMSGVAMMMETLASESWDGMRVELAAMSPTTFTLFQGADETLVEPDAADSVHLMAILADEQSGERISYADVWVTLRDSEGSIVFDERMWPMLSRAMGTHYGINVPLPEAGTYDVDLQVGAPQGARHPEYSDRWLEPTSFAMTYTWNG